MRTDPIRDLRKATQDIRNGVERVIRSLDASGEQLEGSRLAEMIFPEGDLATRTQQVGMLNCGIAWLSHDLTTTRHRCRRQGTRGVRKGRTRLP